MHKSHQAAVIFTAEKDLEQLPLGLKLSHVKYGPNVGDLGVS